MAKSTPGGVVIQMPPDVALWVKGVIEAAAKRHGLPGYELCGTKKTQAHSEARRRAFYNLQSGYLLHRRFNNGQVLYHLGKNPPAPGPSSKWWHLSTTIIGEILGKCHTTFATRKTDTQPRWDFPLDAGGVPVGQSTGDQP